MLSPTTVGKAQMHLGSGIGIPGMVGGCLNSFMSFRESCLGEF